MKSFISLSFCSLFGFLLFLPTGSAQVGATSKVDPSRTNPALSVNGLFLGRINNKGKDITSEAPSGFHIQEVEMRFSSNIDAYFRGEVTLALEKEPGEEFALEPEEVYVETLSLPSITLRAGKFYALLGKHNHLHTHSFPFIDPPFANENILGEEGLNQVGVAGAILLPTSWYSEITLQGFSAGNSLFRTDSSNALVGVYQLKNLWDLTDVSTLELTFGFGHGGNDFDRNTVLYDASTTYKYRESKVSSLSFTAEYLGANQNGASSDERKGGVGIWTQYQFATRYLLGGRIDYLGLPKMDAGVGRKYSALIGYLPSEYSALKAQYDHLQEPGEEETEHRVTLQLNVSLGTHPAHNY